MRKPKSNHAYIKKFQDFNQRTWDYIYDTFDNTFNVLEGSVRSAKTSANVLAFCMALEETNDMIHLAIATTHSAAKTILFEGDGLGILHYPDWQERTEIHDGKRIKFPQRIFEGQYQGNDCLILLPVENSGKPIKYIVAFGGNKADSHLSYRGFSVGMVIATEYDLLHKDTRNEIRSRTIASGYRRFYFDFNPNNPNHSVYKELEDLERADQENHNVLNYLHMTLVDNPALSKERIEEIKAEYDPESIDYKRYILGQRISAAGLIYKVRNYNIIKLPLDELERKRYINANYGRYIIVADPGQNMSATVFTLLALKKDKSSVDVLKEYYHRNADYVNLGIKETDDYAIDYLDFIKECADFMGFEPMSVHSDEDITFIRAFRRLQHQHDVKHNLLSVPKENIDDRIKTGNNLLYKGRLRFSQDCEKTIEAFNIAQYDPKKEDLGKYVRLDDPASGTMIDPIDSVEYGFTIFSYDLGLYKD